MWSHRVRHQFLKAALSSTQTLSTQRIFWLRPPEKLSLVQPRGLPTFLPTTFFFLTVISITWSCGQYPSWSLQTGVLLFQHLFRLQWQFETERKAELSWKKSLVKGQVEGLSLKWKSEDTEMGHPLLWSIETQGREVSKNLPIRSPPPYAHFSPCYKNGHLDSTALACSVPLALGPRPGSALAASPELLATEAREIRGRKKKKENMGDMRGWMPGNLTQILNVKGIINEWKGDIHYCLTSMNCLC